MPEETQLGGAVTDRRKVQSFQDRHKTGLVSIVFTDIVGSTALKSNLGDKTGFDLIQKHHEHVRDILAHFPEGEEINTMGDAFFLAFTRPSDAVQFSLLLQARLRDWSAETPVPIEDRIGIHVGEVFIQNSQGESGSRDLYGTQVDACARIQALADAQQILLSRAAFDNARQVLKGEIIEGIGNLSWLNHGNYQFKGLGDSMEVCEVGEIGQSPLTVPKGSETARRFSSTQEEEVLGWRPAIGQLVPQSYWKLLEKVGEGGFGEVWVGEHQKLKEKRVFKFCFKADRVRSLKREVTLFRLLKEKIGDHPNIVRIYEVNFEEAPYYVVMDYVEGSDLKTWCQNQGGIDKVPLNDRLEIIAQTADALQAAHDSGVAHRDVKPGNILVDRRNGKIQVKLTDFGIGQVLSDEFLAGMTGAGFTMTLIGSAGSQSGTQIYMAPELLAGKKATPQSDIYSLGVVLYQILIEDLTKPLTVDWVTKINDELIQKDLERCFAGEPEGRFASAEELAQGIRSLETRRKELERRQAETAARERAAYRRGMMRTAALASLIVAVVAVLAVYAFSQANKAKLETATAHQQSDRANQEAERAEGL